MSMVPEQGHTRLLLAILVLGIILRILAVGLVWNVEYTSETEDYIRDAHRMLATTGPVIPRRPIALPAAMALVLRAANGDERFLRLIPLGFGVAVLLASAVLARRHGAAYAPLAAALVAFSPCQIVNSAEPLTQMPVALAALAIVLLTLAPHPGSARRGSAAPLIGLVAGVATLFRSSAAPLILIPWTRARSRCGLVRTAVALVVFAVFIGGFIARNTILAGAAMGLNTLDARNLFYGNNHYTPLYKTWVQGNRPEKATGTLGERQYLHEPHVPNDPAASARNYLRSGLREIGEHPGTFLVRSANRLRCWFGFDTNGGATLIRAWGVPRVLGFALIAVEAILWTAALILACGFLVLGFGRAIPELWDDGKTVAATVLLLAAPYVVSFSHPTYHLPAGPLLAVLASWGLCALRGHAVEARVRRRWIVVAVLIVFYIQVEWVAMMADRV